jgi:long-chain acyl-CoA synthetase
MSTDKFTDLVDMEKKAVAEHAHRDLFGTKENGVWNWITYKQFGERVDNFRGGLAKHGIGKGDGVAIISSNRVEWAVAGYATYGLGAVYVPMYEHQLPVDWEYILKDSGAKMLITTTEAIYDKVKDWPGKVDNIEKVVSMHLPASEELSFEGLEAAGKENPIDTVEIDPDSISGFIYTSGTTGKPKGVLLSHDNIVSNVNAVHEIFPLEPEDCSVSFLPWAHSFGQTIELHVMLSMGCHVAFAESVPKLVDNFGEVRPTILVAVPRIFNKIYDGLQKKMNEAGGLKKKLFFAAIANAVYRKELATQGKSSLWADFKHGLFDKLVFSKVRDRFGGRLRYAFSGGAALNPEVARFIDNVGILVYEGYGLTETSPIASCNYPGTRKIGTVGKPIPGVRVELDTSVVEGDTEDGEIIVYGPNVMKGYHNLPEETAKVMTEDGGFRTGDQGRWDKEGFLCITGRIKEQYKLENGKYVVPAPLEEQIQLSAYIVQVYIDGANMLYNIALIVPDQITVEKWCVANGVSGSYDEVLKTEKVKALFEAELANYSKPFKGYERVRQFALITEEFTPENGMLTPSLKLKRRKVLDKYTELLDSLWAVKS